MLERYTIREFQIKTVIGYCNGTLGIANIKKHLAFQNACEYKEGPECTSIRVRIPTATLENSFTVPSELNVVLPHDQIVHLL